MTLDPAIKRELRYYRRHALGYLFLCMILDAACSSMDYWMIGNSMLGCLRIVFVPEFWCPLFAALLAYLSVRHDRPVGDELCSAPGGCSSVCFAKLLVTAGAATITCVVEQSIDTVAIYAIVRNAGLYHDSIGLTDLLPELTTKYAVANTWAICALFVCLSGFRHPSARLASFILLLGVFQPIAVFCEGVVDGTLGLWGDKHGVLRIILRHCCTGAVLAYPAVRLYRFTAPRFHRALLAE